MSEKVSEPIDHVYRCDGLHEPVGLYAGRMKVGGSHATDPEVQGVVELRWLPEPGPYCRYWAHGESSHGILNVGDMLSVDRMPELLDLPSFGLPPRPSGPLPTRPPEARFWGETAIDRRDVGGGTLHRLVVSILNFSNYTASWLHSETLGTWAGRIDLSSLVWHVTLDGVHDANRLAELASSIGGYAVTHTAEIRREDGSGFTPDEARDVLEAVRRFLSLVRGAIVGWALPIGFNHDGDAVWTYWGASLTERWDSRLSWHDDHHPEQLRELFPKFMERWADEFWQGVLSSAISYYLEGNEGFVEKRLVMAAAGLEMLGWVVLYEDQDWLRKNDLERPRASALLRLLLRWAGVPTHLPQSLLDLDSYVNSSNRPTPPRDGPQAVIAVRNRIVHRRRDAPVTPNAIVDAWLLASWYFEMILLRICDYNGQYASRLIRHRWAGSVESVPWTVSA